MLTALISFTLSQMSMIELGHIYSFCNIPNQFTTVSGEKEDQMNKQVWPRCIFLQLAINSSRDSRESKQLRKVMNVFSFSLPAI